MLAICSVVAKLIGAFFRIPLTNILGAEGMGMYQMVFPIYTVVLTLSSGGLPIAISKVVANKTAIDDIDGAKKVLKVSLFLLSCIGIVATIGIVCMHKWISSLQGNSRASIAYLGIAPSIFFVCIICVLKGYFQGRQNMLPSSIMQIVEQIIKLVVGISLSMYFMRWGIEYAVLGAMIGISVSECVAMLTLIGFYILGNIVARRKNIFLKTNLQFQTEVALDWNLTNDIIKNNSTSINTSSSAKSILKAVYKVAMPVTLGAMILPLTQVIDSIIVINFLISAGLSKADATGQYGILNGPVSSLINLPVLITLAISIALLPKVARCFATQQDSTNEVNNAMKYSLLLAFPSFVGVLLFAKDIMYFMYGRGLSAQELDLGIKILQLSSSIIVYAGIMQICTATLQGMDKASRPAFILAISAVIKIVFTIILLNLLGIYGVTLASVLFYLVACLFNLILCRKRIDLHHTSKYSIKIILASIVSFGISFALRELLLGGISFTIRLLLCGGMSVVLYGIVCWLLGLIGNKLKNVDVNI